MILTVKNRSALLDKDLRVVPEHTTKDFFTYFDFQCEHIIDFVHPDEQQRFVDLVTGKSGRDDNRSDVFHLFRNTGQYCYNFVTVRNVKGDYAARIRLFDIYEAIEFARLAAEENGKIRAALGLTDEYLFSYRMSDTLFRISHYTQGREVTVYEMPFATWKKQVVADGYVPEDEVPKLDTLGADFAEFPANFTVKLRCAIRTGGAVMENLRFIGTRHEGVHEGHEERFMMGRILTDESLQQIHHAHNLLDELHLDDLSQVYNKKTIENHAEQKIKAKSAASFALAIVDLDHFKPVNDLYGHMAGDRVIARAAAKMKEIVGDDGVVGRIGGDEFMLILDGIDNVQILRGMLRSVLVQMRKEFEGNFEGISITCSIGAAVYPTNGTTYDELFQKADFCLYRAKDKGRDRYVFFRDDLHAKDYAAAQKAKSGGKKAEGREMQELQYMRHYVQQLVIDPHKAVRDAMRHMLGTYAADNISIYYGKDMRRVLSVGVERAESAEAKYALEDEFRSLLQDGSHVLVNFVGSVPDSATRLIEELRRRGQQSSIQCIIGTADDIRGLVSFDRLFMASQWADYEVNCALLFAASLHFVDLSVFEDDTLATC